MVSQRVLTKGRLEPEPPRNFLHEFDLEARVRNSRAWVKFKITKFQEFVYERVATTFAEVFREMRRTFLMRRGSAKPIRPS
jgi:hypothetical protein